jgi:chromosome segregation ATPase
MEDFDPNNIYNSNPMLNYSNNIQNNAYSMDIGKPNKSIEESLKEKDDKIKSLQRKVKSYQKKNQLQNQRISSKDNLYIEYNSLNKNYAELESELNSLKAENAKLQESLINKNNIICEYEKAIKATSNKFQLYNETEKNLLLKNKENESKLKMLPDLMQNNTELSEKLNGF